MSVATQSPASIARYCIDVSKRVRWDIDRDEAYASSLRDRLGSRMCDYLVALAGAVLLAAEVWAVSGALADRATDVCPSGSIAPESRMRAMMRPFPGDLTTANLSGPQRPALYLRGNCRGRRNGAMMVPREELAGPGLQGTALPVHL